MISMPMALIICTAMVCCAALAIARRLTPLSNRIKVGDIDVRSTTAKDTLETYDIVRKARDNG